MSVLVSPCAVCLSCAQARARKGTQVEKTCEKAHDPNDINGSHKNTSNRWQAQPTHRLCSEEHQTFDPDGVIQTRVCRAAMVVPLEQRCACRRSWLDTPPELCHSHLTHTWEGATVSRGAFLDMVSFANRGGPRCARTWWRNVS